MYSESTQDNTDLHKFYTKQFLVFTESRKSKSRLQRVYTDHLESKGLDRVYTEYFRVYTESTQSLYRVYTESTQSNTESTQLMQVLESLLQIIMVRN